MRSAAGVRKQRFSRASLSSITPSKRKNPPALVRLDSDDAQLPPPDDEIQILIMRVDVADILSKKDPHTYSRRTLRTRSWIEPSRVLSIMILYVSFSDCMI